MEPRIPADLQRQLAHVSELSQWERSQLGRELRRLGWTYAEIGNVVPAAKSTIASWCTDIVLTPDQTKAIRSRTGGRRGIPRDTQRKRRAEIAELESRAEQQFRSLRGDPFWNLGIALYWGEGAKSKRELSITNSDPAIHRLFHAWIATYLMKEPDIVLHLHLHEGNDEDAAKAWWVAKLGLEGCDFDKTFRKPLRQGHRKNHLPFGVARSRVRRSTDSWLTTVAWIELLRLDDRATD